MQSLVGVWKLVEAHAFDASGQEVPSPMGPEPLGVAIFTAECALATGYDGRSTLSPDAKRAFVAYCGPYTFDGTEYVCRVDAASPRPRLSWATARKFTLSLVNNALQPRTFFVSCTTLPLVVSDR
jgi:hypothetical protein